jgi:GR25 family glycosyltransferase involved in LPS biosynthesis
MIPFIFINLKRRTDRYKSCTRQFSEQGFDMNRVFRFLGKDARTYDVAPDEWAMFERADFMRDERIRKPIVCNFLCHYEIWRMMVDENIPYLVVAQDDIIMRNGFMYHLANVLRYLPEDAELVNLGLPEQVPASEIQGPTSRAWFTEEVTPAVSRLHPRINPCSLCYLLTREGAINLLAQAELGVNRAGDGWMNDYCIRNNIFYASSIVLATHRREFGSDIFENSA